MRHNVNVTISQILEAGKTCLSKTHFQSDDLVFHFVTPPSEAQSKALHFVSEANLIPNEIPINSGWILTESLKSHPQAQSVLDQAAFVGFCSRLPETMSYLLGLFDPRQLFDVLDFKNLRGAWVHSSAVIDPTAIIYPGAVVGAGCHLGAFTEIRSHVTLEPFTIIGERCLIHAGTVIGSDGFGFFKNPKNQFNYKIPQIGNVVIGDDVEIGSNCSIDRATLTSTRIGNNTKLDNLVHIAHNTVIGSGGFFAGGFKCAGSVRIGNNFSCGGNVGVSDHIFICDNVTIGAQSAVTKDITEPGFYVGYPIQPWKDGLRTLSNLSHLTEMRKDVAELKKIIKGERS
jgi:acyl-[acyl carrier protein]--UDP-N-acetylglucosamine O-acyltransferase